VPKSGSLGSVRGASSNACPYRENAEQVPKITDAEADPIKISGKAVTVGEASDERTQSIRRDIGDGMSAQEDRCNTGSPLPWAG
jgi:hypothetical protein